MESEKRDQENLKRFGGRVKSDSALVKRRFATAERTHQSLLGNELVVGDVRRRDRRGGELPNRILHQMQAMQEREYLELGLDAPPRRPGLQPRLGPMVGEIATECTLDSNLQLCGAMGGPRIWYIWGEGDPPDDLDQRFHFDDVTTDEVSYSFVANSLFPFTPDHDDYVAAVLESEFVFPIGSTGTYCFLPLIEIHGNVGYSSSGSEAGYLTVMVEYLVQQDGDVIGGDAGHYGVELYDTDVVPLALTIDDFDFDWYSGGGGPVELDSVHLTANISVIIRLGFYNYWNNDGHFILDCASQGGKITNRSLKWGKMRPVRLQDPFPH